MANDNDLAFRGTDADERLHQMYSAFPNFDDTVPIEVIAALIFLDQQAGLYSEDNRVVMKLGFAMWFFLMVQVVDPQLRNLLIAEEGRSDLAIKKAITEQFFEVSFSRKDIHYHEIIRGKKIKVRFMTDEEAERLPFVCTTVAPDGKIIRLPDYIDQVRL